MSMQFGQDFGTAIVGGAEPLNLGTNIFPAQTGQLPREAYQSQTRTVRNLPPKIVKNFLPPQYKTIILP